jgi:hypothetical protein
LHLTSCCAAFYKRSTVCQMLASNHTVYTRTYDMRAARVSSQQKQWTRTSACSSASSASMHAASMSGSCCVIILCTSSTQCMEAATAKTSRVNQLSRDHQYDPASITQKRTQNIFELLRGHAEHAALCYCRSGGILRRSELTARLASWRRPASTPGTACCCRIEVSAETCASEVIWIKSKPVNVPQLLTSVMHAQGGAELMQAPIT